jgi:hypothetical protein
MAATIQFKSGAQMNVERGLTRIWIVLSVAWVLGGFAIAWSDGRNLYPTEYIYRPATDSFEPVAYQERDGLAKLTGQGYFVLVDFPDRSSLLMHKDVRADGIAERFWKNREAKRTQKTIDTMAEYLPGILLPPICALALGFIVAWILSGFKRDPAS